MDKLTSTLDLINSQHDEVSQVTTSIADPLLELKSDSNHTQTTATSSEFDDDDADLINFSNFKLGKLADINDDFDFFETADAEEELPYHSICKVPVRKPRKHIITVSPNSYKPPIEIVKPFCGEILKNALKERLQELPLVRESKCDASFILPDPCSNDSLSSTNFVDSDSSELEYSSPVYSMNLKKGCFFSPNKRFSNKISLEKPQPTTTIFKLKSVMRKCFSREDLIVTSKLTENTGQQINTFTFN